MRVNGGADLQAQQIAGGVYGDGGTTSSAPTATTVTDSTKSWTTNAFAGKAVAMGGLYGNVLSNTATVLTIDQWYTPANPTSTPASTPASGAYTILAGGLPASYMALTTNATAPSLSDTALASELATAGSGLVRKAATFAHTLGTTSYTMTNTFTATSTDQTTGAQTVAKMGMFNSAKSATGIMQFETALSSTATLTQTGDNVTLTQTVSM